MDRFDVFSSNENIQHKDFILAVRVQYIPYTIELCCCSYQFPVYSSSHLSSNVLQG